MRRSRRLRVVPEATTALIGGGIDNVGLGRRRCPIGDTAPLRAWASRSPAAVVESELDDEDDARLYAAEALIMVAVPRAHRDGSRAARSPAMYPSHQLLYPGLPV